LHVDLSAPAGRVSGHNQTRYLSAVDSIKHRDLVLFLLAVNYNSISLRGRVDGNAFVGRRCRPKPLTYACRCRHSDGCTNDYQDQDKGISVKRSNNDSSKWASLWSPYGRAHTHSWASNQHWRVQPCSLTVCSSRAATGFRHHPGSHSLGAQHVHKIYQRV